MKNLALLIGLGGAGAIAYYFLIYKKNNFNSILTNTGLKANKDNVLVVSFNSGKNFAQFYKNNRVIIFNQKSEIVVKGNYLDGGKIITLETGKEITGDSVFQNLLKTIK